MTSRYNSIRVPLKAVQKVGDKTLVDRCIRLLDAVPEIAHTILYGSCESIKKYITIPEHDKTYRFVKRPIWMDGDETTFNDILNHALCHLKTDYIVFMTFTSPFIKPETLSRMIQKIKSKKYDSAFTGVEHKVFAWFDGKPLNYNPSGVPKTQDLDPVILETSSVYIFSRDWYERTGMRIGETPYLQIVDKIEGWDIDTMDDLRIARVIANSTEKPSGTKTMSGW